MPLLHTLSERSHPTAALVSRMPPRNDRRDLFQLGFRMSNLEAWHHRLHDHFREVADRRLVTKWPVFALEHGLSLEQVDDLNGTVRRHIEASGFHSEFYLPFIVYATELGYLYSGDEYWQTFRRETPGWEYVWRDEVRSAFGQFALTYFGAEPQGHWAEHFSIIAWPITHGVIPRDLQHHLVALLHRLRFRFTSPVLLSPGPLGEMLRQESAHTSGRFQSFAENKALLGQVALALLLQDVDGSGNGVEDEILLGGTLTRILADIRRETLSSNRLGEARQEARRRIRGLRPTGGATGETGPGEIEQPSQDGSAAALRYEPEFVLRESTPGCWSIWLQLPNLGVVASAAPEVAEALRSTQATSSAAPGRSIARGRLVNEESPRLRLTRLPDPGEALLEFPGIDHPVLNLALDRLRMPTDQKFLFKVSSDGTARAMRRSLVNPGSSYVFVQREPMGKPAGNLELVEMLCAGAYGLAFSVPPSPSDVLVTLMGVLGLKVKHTVDVWASGIPSRAWSDDGEATWVAGGPLVLGIHTDQAVTDVEMRLDGIEPFISTGPLSAGSDVYVTLGAPPVGMVDAAISVTATSADGTAEHLSDDFRIKVEEPRQDARSSGPISFHLTPQHPTLEDLWEGRVEIHLAAPGPRSAFVRMRLLQSDHRTAVWTSQSTRVALPLTGAGWNVVLQELLNRDTQAAYDEAYAAEVTFTVSDLGGASFTAERDYTPLRWIAREGAARIELLNSTGLIPEVWLASCDHPDQLGSIPYSTAVDGVPIPTEGALLAARIASHSASFVAIPAQKIRGGFSDLRVDISTSKLRRDPKHLIEALRAAQLWELARLSGTALSSIRRQRVHSLMMVEVFSAFCGDVWGRLERALALDSSLQPVQVCSRMAAVLDQRAGDRTLREQFEAERVNLKPPDHVSAIQSFQALAQRMARRSMNAEDAQRVARFAILVASSADAAILFLDELETETRVRLVSLLFDCPTVLRVARYIVTRCEQAGGEEVPSDDG